MPIPPTSEVDAAALEVARRFALPSPPRSASRLGDGLINDTFHVTTTTGDGFVLQRLNPAVFPDGAAVALNAARVAAHLRRHVPDRPGARRALTFVPAPDGAASLAVDGAHWRMAELVIGAVQLPVAASAEVAWEAARAFGGFTRALADFDEPLAETLPGFHDLAGRLRQLQEAVVQDEAGRRGAVAGELERVAEARDLINAIPPTGVHGDLPLRVAHNDAKLGNLLFDADTRAPLCVIDLDTVMRGSALWDTGDLLRSLASAAPEDAAEPEEAEPVADRVEAIRDGWLVGAGGAVSREERARLLLSGAVVAAEQAARFLADYLRGDRYYRVADPEQNLRRARVQLVLLEGLRRLARA